jgi:hypothetical protein
MSFILGYDVSFEFLQFRMEGGPTMLEVGRMVLRLGAARSRAAGCLCRSFLRALPISAGHFEEISFFLRHSAVPRLLIAQVCFMLDLVTCRRVGRGLTLRGSHRRSCQAGGLWQRHRSAGVHVESVERHSTARVVLVLALSTLRYMRPVFGVVECHVAPHHLC